jgi:hypothetical protein
MDVVESQVPREIAGDQRKSDEDGKQVAMRLKV